jgi:hypothetical protein
VNHEQAEFAEFFQASWEPCLRAVVAVVGSPPRLKTRWRRRSPGLGVVAEGQPPPRPAGVGFLPMP